MRGLVFGVTDRAVQRSARLCEFVLSVDISLKSWYVHLWPFDFNFHFEFPSYFVRS